MLEFNAMKETFSVFSETERKDTKAMGQMICQNGNGYIGMQAQLAAEIKQILNIYFIPVATSPWFHKACEETSV